MELVKVTDNIFMVKCKNQYQLTSTFMRLQEFYESPYENIRGKYFTVEEYMDTYAGDTGNFTYNSDWNGFNVPGNIVEKFFDLFREQNIGLLEKELKLYCLLDDYKAFDLEKFYVIGVHECKLSSMRHEVAHAFYYTNDKYTMNMNGLFNRMNLSAYIGLKKVLLDMGYCEEVINDEIQAYLSTSSYWELIKDFGIINTLRVNIPAFRKVFKEHSTNVV